MVRVITFAFAMSMLVGCTHGDPAAGPVRHDLEGRRLGFCPTAHGAMVPGTEGRVDVLPGSHPDAEACRSAAGEVDVTFRGPSFEVGSELPRVVSARATATDDSELCPASDTDVAIALFNSAGAIMTFTPDPELKNEDGSDLRVGLFDMVTINPGRLDVSYRHRLIDGFAPQKGSFEADTTGVRVFPVVVSDGCDIVSESGEPRQFDYRLDVDVDMGQ